MSSIEDELPDVPNLECDHDGLNPNRVRAGRSYFLNRAHRRGGPRGGLGRLKTKDRITLRQFSWELDA